MNIKLPTGWTSTHLGDVALEVRNGISVKPSADSGTRILRISAVRPMALEIEDVRFLEGPALSWESYRLRKDDLLFTRYNGNPLLVGACARVVTEPLELIVYPDKLIRLRVDTSVADPRFIEIAIHTEAARTFIGEKTKTSAGQVGISGKDLKEVPLPLPPLNEQRRIVVKLNALLEKCRKVRDLLDTIRPAGSAGRSGPFPGGEIGKSLRLLDSFEQAILAKAFRGELVPQDPNDEPASVLLDRTRAERAASSEKGTGRRGRSSKSTEAVG